MDTTLATVADSLGTTVDRVSRAVERLGIRLSGPRARERGRPTRFIAGEDVDRLRAALGSAPKTSALTREELFVLSALAAQPKGFASTRALARAAGVSPTTAASAVERLLRRRFVKQMAGLTRMSGRVVDATLIMPRLDGAAWSRHAAKIAATTPPVSSADREPVVIPRRFWHLFWNASPATIRVDEHPDYIAWRLFSHGDEAAKDWAVAHLPAASVERARARAAVTADDWWRAPALTGSTRPP